MVQVGKSKIQGLGLFTDCEIKKDEVLQIGMKLLYVNHCCRPNCELEDSVENVDHIALRAKRDIGKNEELNFNYRKSQYKNEFECFVEEEGHCFCPWCFVEDPK